MTDMDTYIRFLVGLLFVLGLILALAWLAKRLNLIPGALKITQKGPRRLSVVEIAVVDTRRRLVLVRRDEVEHLVLLGPNSETVVETGITPASSATGGKTTRSISSSVPGTGETGMTT